jgi:hypothetical protein
MNEFYRIEPVFSLSAMPPHTPETNYMVQKKKGSRWFDVQMFVREEMAQDAIDRWIAESEALVVRRVEEARPRRFRRGRK